jgi:hypothetical protein
MPDTASNIDKKFNQKGMGHSRHRFFNKNAVKPAIRNAESRTIIKIINTGIYMTTLAYLFHHYGSTARTDH